MRVAWQAYPASYAGNNYGFASAAQRYVQALCQADITVTPSADLVLHWCAAGNYAPEPGKRNIAGLVCESLNLHPDFLRVFLHPDTTAIFTPSTFCQDVFQQHTHKPVYVVGHSVDTETFAYQPRLWPPAEGRSRPFTFLYAGARNPRKGVDFLDEWWSMMGLYREQGVQLYLKMTLGVQEQASLDAAGVPTTEVWHEGNVICDTRNLSVGALAALYQQAQCFVLPTRGEGFALTLADAMATGAPCIVTGFGGHRDYCDDDSAYMVRYRPAPFLGTDGTAFIGARPDPEHWCAQVRSVLADYGEACARGRRAAERIRQDCTPARVSAQLRRMIDELERSAQDAVRQSG